MNRNLKYLFCLLFSLCVLVGCDIPSIRSGSPDIQKGSLPPDLLGLTLDGHDIYASEFRGKVIMLIFWKSWCEACKKELQEVKGLQNAYQDKLILFAINSGEPRSMVRTFKRQYLLDFLVLMDPQSKVFSAYGIHVWPTTILINQQGQVHWTAISADIELIRQEIELLLKENQHGRS
jgi:thiol-disulfide isomerase/thioredoxin